MTVVMSDYPSLKDGLAARWHNVKNSKPRWVGLICSIIFSLTLSTAIYVMKYDSRFGVWITLWVIELFVVWAIFFPEKFNKINDYPGILFDKLIDFLLIKFPSLRKKVQWIKKISDTLSEWVKENYKKFWLVLLIPFIVSSAAWSKNNYSFLADWPLWKVALLQAVMLAVMMLIILFLNRKKIIREIFKEKKILLGKKRVLLGVACKDANAMQLYQDLPGNWTSKYLTLEQVNAFYRDQKSFLNVYEGGVNIFLVKIREEEAIEERYPEKNLQIIVLKERGEPQYEYKSLDDDHIYTDGSCWVVYRPWF